MTRRKGGALWHGMASTPGEETYTSATGHPSSEENSTCTDQRKAACTSQCARYQATQSTMTNGSTFHGTEEAGDSKARIARAPSLLSRSHGLVRTPRPVVTEQLHAIQEDAMDTMQRGAGVNTPVRVAIGSPQTTHSHTTLLNARLLRRLEALSETRGSGAGKGIHLLDRFDEA